MEAIPIRKYAQTTVNRTIPFGPKVVLTKSAIAIAPIKDA